MFKFQIVINKVGEIIIFVFSLILIFQTQIIFLTGDSEKIKIHYIIMQNNYYVIICVFIGFIFFWLSSLKLLNYDEKVFKIFKRCFKKTGDIRFFSKNYQKKYEKEIYTEFLKLKDEDRKDIMKKIYDKRKKDIEKKLNLK